MANKNTKFFDIVQQIGELKGKVDQMSIEIGSRFDSLEKRMMDMHNSIKETQKTQEKQIDDLQRNAALMQGKAAGIAIAASTIIGGLIALFSHFR